MKYAFTSLQFVPSNTRIFWMHQGGSELASFAVIMSSPINLSPSSLNSSQPSAEDSIAIKLLCIKIGKTQAHTENNLSKLLQKKRIKDFIVDSQ